MSEEVGVTITLKEIYDELRNLVAAVSPLPSQIADQKVSIEKHEERLSAVEKKVWVASGAAATIGTALGAIVPVLLGK